MVSILLLVYVLSIGPVFALMRPDRALDSFQGFQTLYAPLYWVAHRNRFCSTQMVRYLLFWEYLINPPPPDGADVRSR